MCYVHFCCATLLPAQYAMYVLFVLHYVSTGCYVLLVCVRTTCQCRVLCMSCFVLHYCQRSVPCMSCLCYSTSSAVCYVCLVCVALLPAKCAAVEHCQRSEPCGGYNKSSFHFYFHIFLLFLPIFTSWEWMSTGVFNQYCQ